MSLAGPPGGICCKDFAFQWRRQGQPIVLGHNQTSVPQTAAIASVAGCPCAIALTTARAQQRMTLGRWYSHNLASDCFGSAVKGSILVAAVHQGMPPIQTELVRGLASSCAFTRSTYTSKGAATRNHT
eukprot:6176397-Pleurochrysis_carterae.AAC.3